MSRLCSSLVFSEYLPEASDACQQLGISSGRAYLGRGRDSATGDDGSRGRAGEQVVW